MSNKKKTKLNKKLIEQRLRELEAETRQPKNIDNQKVEARVDETIKKDKNKALTENKLDESEILILKDVKKIGVVALIMLVIFIALFFVKIKTDYILQASNKIINVLHIGQL